MKPIVIKPNVYFVGAIDWDRRLFDNLVPLPDGTSYNAFLIKGSEKTALVDTVDFHMGDVLFDFLKDVDRIDYIIAHHGEQDHSGTLPKVLERYPEAKVYLTPKAKGIFMDLLHLPEDKFVTVEDKQTLSLGDKTIEFLYAPWVHWPETMFTYLREDKILFTADCFGSHLAASDLFVQDECLVYEAAKRYYAEIMMPFSGVIKRNMKKIEDYDIEIIAPDHGPLHGRPAFILEAYRHWIYDDPKNEVVIPYISMHGSTQAMVNHLTGALSERGVTVKLFNLSEGILDVGKLAMALVDPATLVVGTPTVLTGPHPNVAYGAFLINALRPKVRFLSIIGSYGWGTKAVDVIKGLLPNLGKTELLDPVIIKGFPRDEDLKALEHLANTIAQKHKENGFA